MPSLTHRNPVAGLLLTGGASRRMGFDKARVTVAGTPLAVRLGRQLDTVTEPTLEIGPGTSGLEAVLEPAPGQGPLVALAVGASALRARGHAGPALLIATDLPCLDTATLRRLRDRPGTHSVVPMIDGRAQPLCARWSAAALRRAVELADTPERRMAALLDLPDTELVEGLDPAPFADADTPAALDALGLDWRAP